MAILGPTLTRRLLFSLCAAFFIVWVVLLLFQYSEVRRRESHNPALEEFALQILVGLQGFDSPDGARTFVRAIDSLSSNARRRQSIPGKLVLQLWDRRTGERLFSSDAVFNATLPANIERQSQLIVAGLTYEVLARESGLWSVRVGRTRLDRRWIVRGVNADLLRYLLVAFPFVLIPTWIAVRHGLRPLKRLSAILAARPIDDLSPIAFAVRHEEIEPVVKALDDLLGRLSATLSRERTFLHDAAHELRTPLAAISAQAYALVGARAPETGEAANRLQTALDRAARIIQQLLDLARLDNLDPMRRVRTDIANRLREILAEMAPAATGRQMDLVFEGPEHFEATTEVGALESIVTNLVDNAIRYGSQGGTIMVELQVTSQDWTLSVCDDGPGIAPEARAHMFERFIRGAHQHIPGTGLGLAIVRQAARRLGTAVAVTDGLEGRGIRFSFSVPLVH